MNEYFYLSNLNNTLFRYLSNTWRTQQQFLTEIQFRWKFLFALIQIVRYDHSRVMQILIEKLYTELKLFQVLNCHWY